MKREQIVINGTRLDRYVDILGRVYNGKGIRMPPRLVKNAVYVEQMIGTRNVCKRLDYIVGELFMEKPADAYRIEHIDHDPCNCCVDNLLWVTPEMLVERYMIQYGLTPEVVYGDTWREIDTPAGKLEISPLGVVRKADTKEIVKQYRSFDYRCIYYVDRSTPALKTKILMVHRLVAKAYIPNPEGYDIVNHLDANKQNCCVYNLEWCDQSMNTTHAYLNDRINRINHEVIHEACKLMEEGELSDVEISRITGIDRHSISDIRIGRRHKNISKLYNIPDKRWNKDVAMAIVDMINQGYAGMDLLRRLDLGTDQAAISFYERVRREYKHLIDPKYLKKPA